MMIIMITILNNQYEQVTEIVDCFLYLYLKISEPLIFLRRPQSTQIPFGNHAIFYCSSSSSPIIWSKV